MIKSTFSIMYLKNIRFFKHTTKLEFPILIKGSSLLYRESILCKFINYANEAVWSELIVLKALNQSTLYSSFIEFRRIKKLLLQNNWCWESLLGEISQLPLMSDPKQFSSLHFCIEIAIFQYLKKTSLDKFYIKIPINTLIRKGDKSLVNQINAINSRQYQAIKFKLGQLTVEEAKKKVTELYLLKSSKQTLRLDINSRWSLHQFLSFTQYFGSNCFEYIEDPVNELESLKFLEENFTYPIALDELLGSFVNLWSLDKIKAFVIKPGMIGSLKEIINLLNLAFIKNIVPVFTGTFESDLGIVNVLFLLHHLNINVPAGFDTYHWIDPKSRLIKNQVYFYQGYLYAYFADSFKIKVSKLHEI
nr:4-(2'-carboxyphenyl)-4-oxybutyric acid synthase [Cavernulicola chilensis]